MEKGTGSPGMLAEPREPLTSRAWGEGTSSAHILALPGEALSSSLQMWDNEFVLSKSLRLR